MPQAVAIAGIQGAATLGGALLSNRGQGRALDAQRRSNQDALRFQREQLAASNQRYERDYAAYQQRQQQRNAILQGVLGRYGITFGGPAAGAAPAGTPVTPTADRGPGAYGQPGALGGAPSMGAPSIGAPVAPGSQLMPQPRQLRPGSGLNLADLGGWR